jgi:hypothetical protein
MRETKAQGPAFPPWPHGPVDKYVSARWAQQLNGSGPLRAKASDLEQMRLMRIARARPVSPAGERMVECEVATVHRLYNPHFLKRFGPVLRVAMEDMLKEEMPREIGDLLSRLRQLEPSARRHARREPGQR